MIIEYEKFEKEKRLLSIVMDELEIFFRIHTEMDDEYGEELAETIVELVGNALEHSNSDCLLDIDITRVYPKNKLNKNNYNSFNIALLNLSNTVLGDPVKKKFEDGTFECSPKTYKLLCKAYENHKEYFTSDYSEEDFFNVASFQWRVSGRAESTDTNGGTGLTNLLYNLIEKSEGNSSYMMSGNRVVFFKKDLVSVNEDKLSGFNTSNDFVYEIPDKSSIGDSRYKLKGTLFNLHFIKNLGD